MKKIISWLLLIATALTLTSCNKTTYPAVESSKKESQVLMKIGSGKKSYEVRYELYRAFYLTLREDYGEALSAEQEDELEARVLDNSGYTAKEAANVIAEVIECDVVSCVGTKFVLYRESEKKKRIELP